MLLSCPPDDPLLAGGWRAGVQGLGARNSTSLRPVAVGVSPEPAPTQVPAEHTAAGLSAENQALTSRALAAAGRAPKGITKPAAPRAPRPPAPHKVLCEEDRTPAGLPEQPAPSPPPSTVLNPHTQPRWRSLPSPSALALH